MSEIICIVCPIGCRITVETGSGSNVLNISGYGCKRGEAYAGSEFIAPKRIVTSVVAVEGREKLLPVKTGSPIPKEKIFDAMKELRGMRIKPGVKVGDVITNNLAGTGIPLVATKNME